MFSKGIPMNELPAISWDEIEEKVGTRAESRCDIEVDTTECWFTEDGQFEFAPGEKCELNGHAYQQLCASLGTAVSPRYLRQFPAGGPAGWANQLNYLLREGNDLPGKMLMRGSVNGKHTGEAWLSIGYGRFDDEDLMASIRSIVSDGVVFKFEQNANSTVLQAALGDAIDVTGNGDHVFSGITYGNSGTGAGKLNVMSSQMRMLCSNLWHDLLGERYRFSRKHFYGARSHAYAVSEVVEELEFVGYKIRGKQGYIEEIMRSSIERKVPRPDQKIRALLTKGGFTKRVKEEASNHLLKEPGDTAWHVVQAITAAARTMPTPWSHQERLALESLAGQYMQEVS